MSLDMSWTTHADKAQRLLQEDNFSDACFHLKKAREGCRKLLDTAGEVIRSGEMKFPTGSFASISRDYAVSLSNRGDKRQAEEVALDTWNEVVQYVKPPPSKDEKFVDRMMGIGKANELMMTIFIQLHQNRNLPDGRSYADYSEESTAILDKYSDKFQRLAESMS